MAKQIINLGTPPEGEDGDTNYVAWQKANGNFTELYDSVSDLSASVSGQASFKNKLINGNFNVWQRGTSFAAATGTRYTADRWVSVGVGSTSALSQQAFALGQGVVPWEPSYFLRTVVASSAGASNLAALQQNIEGVRNCAGRTMTLSFWAKADAAKNIAVELSQVFGTGGSPSSQVINIGTTTVALTAGWVKKTITFTIPAIAGKTLGTNNNDYTQLTFWFDAGTTYAGRSNGLGQQSGTFDIAQVQLELGTAATAFELVPPAIELTQCQRYCFAATLPAGGAFAAGTQYSTTGALAQFNTPVQMRAFPTLTITGQGIGWVGNGTPNSGNPTIAGSWNGQFVLLFTISGATTGQSGFAAGKSGGTTLMILDAEL